MIAKDQVEQWAADASETLTSAQNVCKSAETQLQDTNFDIHSRLAYAINSGHDIVVALQEQINVIDKILMAANNQRLDTESTDAKIVELKLQLSRLARIVTNLETTVVPHYLLKLNDKNKLSKSDKTLKDFISLTSVELLQDNTKTYIKNCEAIRKWRSETTVDIAGRANLYKKQIIRLVQNYDNEASGTVVESSVGIRTNNTAFASRSLAETIDKENKSLEAELVTLLELLTNHYDQCSRALSLPWSNKEAMLIHQEDLLVLQGDSQDLFSVYKEVCTIQEIITNNRDRASKYVNTKLPPFEKIINSSRNLLSTIREFKCKTVPLLFATIARTNEILKKYVINGEKISSGDPLQSYTMAISDLCNHYSRFSQIYADSYLNELRQRVNEYPQRFVEKISDFLNGELSEFRRKEILRRAQWVKQHGEYIPNEFILPDEVPSVVQIITNIDDIEAPNVNENNDFAAVPDPT